MCHAPPDFRGVRLNVRVRQLEPAYEIAGPVPPPICIGHGAEAYQARAAVVSDLNARVFRPRNASRVVATRALPPKTVATRLDDSLRRRVIQSMQTDADPLRPVFVFLPDWSARRIADNARASRIPGAVKVGGMWMLRPSDFSRWVGERFSPREES